MIFNFFLSFKYHPSANTTGSQLNNKPVQTFNPFELLAASDIASNGGYNILFEMLWKPPYF